MIPGLPSGRTDYARYRHLTCDNMIPGDGNIPNALTDVADVGRYVALIIADQRTLNKMVFAYNEVMTANQAYDLMEKLSGEKIPRNYVSTRAVPNPSTFSHALTISSILFYDCLLTLHLHNRFPRKA